ncbi:MAG: protein-disulfide reductase DsbD N-terminal domain-containing protein, partial [Phycisphaerae bacterium]|nr:protein-disulfide reductase DsbD N-terminal domain-containing protein [Phycisphaerae bacterium]
MIHSKSITRIHCNKKWLAVWFALIAFTVNAQSAKAQFSLDTSKPQVRVEAIPQYDPAPTGQPFALAIVFDIAPGGHLYANPKKGELGLDTKITPVSLEGIRFGNVVYDPGILYTDKNNEGMTNQVYEGKVVCYLPVEIDKAYAKSPLTVDLNLSGLLCSEDGSCIPWDDKVSVSINVPADPPAAKMNQEELFAGKNIALVFSGPGVDSG